MDSQNVLILFKMVPFHSFICKNVWQSYSNEWLVIHFQPQNNSTKDREVEFLAHRKRYSIKESVSSSQLKWLDPSISIKLIIIHSIIYHSILAQFALCMIFKFVQK